MLVYIKKRGDFTLAMRENTESYSLPAASVSGETGKAVLAGHDGRDHTGDWLYIGGRIVLISQASPKDGKLTIATADAAEFFDRPLVWPDAAPGTYGEFIKAALEREYIGCSDTAYRVPYLSVENTDATPMTAPELDDTKLYKLSDIMAQARRAGVVIDFGICSRAKASDTLQLRISTGTGTARRVVFSDGSAQLATETYSKDSVAKVTVLREVPQENADSDSVYESRDFYLSAAGEISTSVPAARAEGRWEYVTAKAEEDPAEKAAAVFAKNIQSHKIEFFSEKEFGLYDTVLLRLAGTVFKTQIVSIVISSGDRRFSYKCGELAVTLPEKVKRMSGGGGSTTTVNYNTGIPDGSVTLAKLSPEVTAALGGIQIGKLWENASPSSFFGAQTVSMALTPYEAVEIVWATYVSDNGGVSRRFTGKYPIIWPTDGSGVGCQATGMYGGYVAERFIRFYSSGIVFDNGAVYNPYGGSSIASAQVLVPLEIYGIKGVT